MTSKMMEDRHDTIFEDENGSKPEDSGLADIDFDLLDTQGKWLVKVISGPNSGAEFSLIADSNYLVGTDPTSCDIVFTDLSVSRQHARIIVDSEDRVVLEDLNSKNGTFVDGEKLTGRKSIESNTLITMGTTTFMLIDRNGEHHTIISAPLPAAKKEEKKEDAKEHALNQIQSAVLAPIVSEVDRIKEEERQKAKHAQAVSSFIVLAVVAGLFVLAGIGTTMLFQTEKIQHQKTEEIDELITKALSDYPALRYSYNPSNGRLLLIGHLQSPVDRSKMLDNLQQIKSITGLDYSNVIIDEYVWREMNQLLAKNGQWKSVTVSSPSPGKFVLTGFLKTRKEAEALNEYVSQNFAYPDLLETKIIVEEELKSQIAKTLIDAGMRNVSIALVNGDLTLTGSVANGQMAQLTSIADTLRATPGIRAVQVYVTEVAPEQALINISDRYQVSGYSAKGRSLSVVINGRILTKGDVIDGMVITDIQPSAVILEKDGFRYRIDFNR